MKSITDLKQIVQAYKGTIEDPQTTAFDTIVVSLWNLHKDTTLVLTLLKMMRTLNQYLASKKLNAHADAVPLLESLIFNLEKITTTPSLDEDDAKKIVADQIAEYKIFQGKITSTPDISDDDLDSLKSVILAIDWEISDQTLKNFETVVLSLLSKLKGYKIHYSFLRIIHTTGRFIGIQKANAPTDSISFLRSVFENLDNIIKTKGMGFNEKKQLLESDIERFQAFKQRVSTQKITTTSQESVSQETESDVMPALSHLKKGSDSDQDHLTLTELPNDSDVSVYEDDDTLDDVQPALSGRPGASEEPRGDVMDDLFTVKESPADDLLDAIHLMEVHGERGQDHAMKMLDEADESQSDGLKKYTTQRKDTAPIDEIGSRLDEFFSLETPQESASGLQEAPSEEPSEIVPQTEESSDYIVPFEAEDETIEDSDTRSSQTSILKDSSDLAVAKRLETCVKKGEWKEDKNQLAEILEDIDLLKNSWQDDPKKHIMLEIVSFCIRPSVDNFDMPDQIEENRSLQESPGLWKKIKSKFTS